ncbi:MAG: TonB-dependent receptor [Acidobacteria bacterium]|nr:TonB-dependent receptor [Acidobacteriota bacterium]
MMNRKSQRVSAYTVSKLVHFYSLLLIAFLCLQATAFGQTPKLKLEGRVKDQNGAAISGASVVLTAEAVKRSAYADEEGRFDFPDLEITSATIRVSEPGFAPFERQVNLQLSSTLEIILAPASVAEQLTITAERTLTRVSDTAASIAVLAHEDLSTTAALTLDDALRQVPGFSLFRRSGSRTANPTSQGVSLRGVGASGASRAVVLNDGVPLNDPFGGWVYWGRTPRQSLDRIEVVRGGASNLYGTDALGGVINFIPRENLDSAFALETSYGNQQSPNASMFVGGRFGQLGAQLSAEVFHTDGYIIVDKNQRGRVDTQAGVEYSTLDLLLERFFEERGRVFIRGSVFGESRGNGTPLQTNRTHIRQLSTGADFKAPVLGALVIRLYIGSQVFDQYFSAVAAGRNSESLTRSQRTPAQQFGFASQWSRVAGTRQTLVAGFDFREVRGASDELVFNSGRATSAVGAGGRERTFGIFGQDLVRLTQKFFATIGGRLDRWRNYDALSATKSFSTKATTATLFKARTETAFSPRLSLLYKVNEKVSLTASAYRAFRAPTLNELYRSFRVGNVITQANDKLLAERLTGAEGGASLTAFQQRLYVRGAFFWSEITRPVANVTLSLTPDLITRQRRNLGRTRSSGVEIESQTRLTNTLSFSSGYLFAAATVVEFPANRNLEGLLIPQVARHQFTFQTRYANPAILTFALQGRAIGAQFDDDQNQLKLNKFFVLDAYASRRLNSHFEAFVAIENLFNQRYEVGRTNVTTIGPPLLARGGFRVHFGAK